MKNDYEAGRLTGARRVVGAALLGAAAAATALWTAGALARPAGAAGDASSFEMALAAPQGLVGSTGAAAEDVAVRVSVEGIYTRPNDSRFAIDRLDRERTRADFYASAAEEARRRGADAFEVSNMSVALQSAPDDVTGAERVRFAMSADLRFYDGSAPNAPFVISLAEADARASAVE